MTDAPTSRRRAFSDGVVAVGPMLLGVAPFGVVLGALAERYGFALSPNATASPRHGLSAHPC